MAVTTATVWWEGKDGSKQAIYYRNKDMSTNSKGSYELEVLPVGKGDTEKLRLYLTCVCVV